MTWLCKNKHLVNSKYKNCPKCKKKKKTTKKSPYKLNKPNWL